MNQNSLIEIGSKADVIIRFKTNMCINDRMYEAGEPYLFLEEVNVVIDYSNKENEKTTDMTHMAYSDIKPRVVHIGGVSFSRKLASLLSTYEDGDAAFNAGKFMKMRAEGGLIFLTEEVDQSSIFVYDKDYNRVEFQYDEGMNALESDLFEDQETYLISFSSVGVGTRFSLNKPHVPYMSLEIQGVGNIDKQTKRVLMYFDRVSLNSLVQFTFIQGDMINVPLQFQIIGDKGNYVVFEG